MTSFEGEPKPIVMPSDTSLRDEIQAKYRVDSEAERLRQEEAQTAAQAKKDMYPKVLELVKGELVDLADMLEQEGVPKKMGVPVIRQRTTKHYYGLLHFLEVGPYSEETEDIVAGTQDVWLLEERRKNVNVYFKDMLVDNDVVTESQLGLSEEGLLVEMRREGPVARSQHSTKVGQNNYTWLDDDRLVTELAVQPTLGVEQQTQYRQWHEKIVGWGAKLLVQAEK